MKIPLNNKDIFNNNFLIKFKQTILPYNYNKNIILILLIKIKYNSKYLKHLESVNRM